MDDTGIFGNAYDDEDVGAEADLNNLETTMNVSPIPTTRIDKHYLRGGSGPKCQDTILGGADAQTKFETASKQSNDLPVSRGYTLGSVEDSMKLLELMELCTKLADLVSKKKKEILRLMLVYINVAKHKFLLLVYINAAKHKVSTAGIH
ncbi:hypothetical protein Tco_0847721 [Tanacetum coccineum]